MSSDLFSTLFVHPILNLLLFFHKIYLMIGLPGAFGFAIVSLTIAVRLLLHPFFTKQMHTTKKMQELKPKLDELTKKHKGNPTALQQEQMQLYKDAGINPAAGCLFALVQMPVFIGLYTTLNELLSHGAGKDVIAKINGFLYSDFLKITTIDPHFLGFNLAMSPANAKLWYYYMVPVVTAFLQYYQAKVTMPSPVETSKKSKKEEAGKSEKKDQKDKKEESSNSEEFQKALNTQMKYLFPVMIGYFAFTLPVGLSLYWNIFSIFSIIQHAHHDKKQTLKEIKN